MRMGKKAAKAIVYMAVTPVMLIWAFSIFMNIPPVQDFIITKINESLGDESGLEFHARNIRYSFPCKIELTGFTLTKDEKVIASGKKASADLPLFSLLTGKADLNSILLENAYINTSGMFRSADVDGTIGYARLNSDEIDFEKELIAMKSMEIACCDLHIEQKLPVDTIFHTIETLGLTDIAFTPGTCTLNDCHFAIEGEMPLKYSTNGNTVLEHSEAIRFSYIKKPIKKLIELYGKEK
ncbi:MAG: hypothetical protein IKL75_00890 [Bacteroidaceae bacterium]|nr:hypothetical protein [Bacteroidaceae bacterium]